MKFSCLFLGIVTGCLCFGQSVSIGAKGGVPLLNDTSGDATSESKRYTVGPMVELGLPFGFGVEFDALYRRVGFRTDAGSVLRSSFMQERLNSWQFPILLKYKLPIPIAKPYAVGGYVRQVMNGTDSFNTPLISNPFSTGQTSYSHSASDANRSAVNGFVLGAGVRLSVGKIQVSPEVRYTRWIDPAIQFGGSQGYTYRSNRNQVDLLVGFGWKIH